MSEEMLDRLATEKLGMHIQWPGDKAEGIEDHRLDGVPAGDEALRNRRNQGVDLLDETNLIDGARHNAQVVESLDARGLGCLNMTPEPPEKGECEENTSLKPPLYQKKRHMSSHGKRLRFNFFCVSLKYFIKDVI